MEVEFDHLNVKLLFYTGGDRLGGPVNMATSWKTLPYSIVLQFSIFDRIKEYPKILLINKYSKQIMILTDLKFVSD